MTPMSLVARLSIVAAVLTGAVLVVLPVASLASTIRVDVVDNLYDDGNRDGNAQEGEERRAHTVVVAGDIVAWEWKGDNQHTVTSRADAPVQFDSDAECDEDTTACRSKGNVFAVRFEQPGTYNYYCKIHADPTGLTGMVGTIEVQAPPEPSESDSGAETSSEPASEEPSSEPEPSGSSEPDDPTPEPTSEPAPEPQEDPSSGDPDTTSDGADTPSRRQARAPGFGVRDEPDRDALGPEAPEVAPGPSFSPFPSAPDLPEESETEDMAVNVPSRGGGPPRGVVVGVAIVSVIGSAGAFGKVVLFGRPWT